MTTDSDTDLGTGIGTGGAFMVDGRTVLRISGADHRGFLEDLVTNAVARVADGPVYAALLTPQGKYLADFLLVADGDGILLDADAAQAPALVQRLSMYRLRAKVDIAQTDLRVVAGWNCPAPAGAVADPRASELGWRLYTAAPETVLTGLPPADPAGWEALRIRLGVPIAGAELVPNESYILEAGFDRLNGVDFRKGCYVGQEVTARMRHKTELRKGYVRVQVTGPAPAPGTPLLAADGREAGKILSTAGEDGIAYLRFDRAGGELTAGAATVTRRE